MKTTMLLMAIALMNFYFATEKKQSLFAGLAGQEFTATDQNVHPRLRTATDTIAYHPSPARLKEAPEGQLLEMSFSSFGCFNQYARKLVFRSTADGITVTLYNTKPAAGVQFPDAEMMVTKLMAAEDWAAWQEFESGLYAVRDGGCTTTERYVLSDEAGSISVTDASCAWFGFNTLMTGFFGKPDPGVKKIG